MDEVEFKEYVTDQKNDFANWIKDVEEAADLALKLGNVKTKDQTLKILNEHKSKK